MSVLTEAFVPAEFVQFVVDEIERKTLLRAPHIIFLDEPSDLHRCYEMWYGTWDEPTIEFDDDEHARLDGNTLYVRRTNDPRITFEAAIAAGAPTC